MVTYTHLVGGAQQLLFYKVSTKMHSCGSGTPLPPPFWALWDPGG